MPTIIIEGVDTDDADVKPWVKQVDKDLVDFIYSHKFRDGIYADGMVAGFAAGIVAIVKDVVKDADPVVSRRFIDRIMGMLLHVSERVVEIGEEIK